MSVLRPTGSVRLCLKLTNPCHSLVYSQQRQYNYVNQVSSQMGHYFLQYASDCYITQSIQAVMEAFQWMGLAPTASFVATGLVMRLATAPLNIMADSLSAKRFHGVNFLTRNVLQKVGDHYKVPLIYDKSTSQLTLNTADRTIIEEADKLVKENEETYCSKQGLQMSRIMCLKSAAIPVWVLSSFAIRNLVDGASPASYDGFLWLDSLLEPDPYYVFPLCVTALGFLNLYTSRFLRPKNQNTKVVAAYNVLFGFTMIVVGNVLSLLPAYFPIYWSSVAATGIIQSVMLRSSRVKQLLRIGKLPTDSPTPFRDLIFVRKN
uniref:Mitochondrial inner membrane protein COX18 n=1 Tax=Ditylenchus dipsaci TaxID=166011 RepID=A0A915DCX0_9BILA